MSTRDPLRAGYDVVVIGGGSAGCVLANRLSAAPERTVLLVEAGPGYPPDAYPDALTRPTPSTEPWTSWGYQSVPGATQHAIAAHAGRILGGGSAINAGIARRARPDDFARWVRHGLPEWSYEQVEGIYRTLERTTTGDDRWHGRTGPWPVHQASADEVPRPVRAFLDAAASLGLPWVADLNGPHHGGVAAEVKNIEAGVRVNAGMVFLPADVRSRPNLTIRCDATVDRVGFGSARASCVHLVDGQMVQAGHVVVSAGVYGTPALLLRSGIGPAGHLRDLGIEVVADLPVGGRLQDQPMYTAAYLLHPEAPDPVGGSGVVWTPSADAVGDELDLHLSLSVQPTSEVPGTPERMLRVWVSVTTPRSTGTVRLKSREPRVTPSIDYRLLTDPLDRRRLREAVRLTRRTAGATPVAELIQDELFPGARAETDAELDAAVDAGVMTYYHGTSTAPMGGDDDPAAVTDGQGRVRGVDALWVCDASVIPEAISAPTNLTVLMIAERTAATLVHVL